MGNGMDQTWNLLDTFSQTTYFILTLSIKQNVNLLKLLKQGGTVDIVKAVKVGTKNFEHGILCNKSRSKIYALQEIMICPEALMEFYTEIVPNQYR